MSVMLILLMFIFYIILHLQLHFWDNFEHWVGFKRQWGPLHISAVMALIEKVRIF